MGSTEKKRRGPKPLLQYFKKGLGSHPTLSSKWKGRIQENSPPHTMLYSGVEEGVSWILSSP